MAYLLPGGAVLQEPSTTMQLLLPGGAVFGIEVAETTTAGPSIFSAPAGRSSKKSRRRYQVEIDGQQFVVSTEAEAEELVAKAKEAAEETAKAKATEVVRKRLAKHARDGRLNTKPVELDQPSVTVQPASDGYIDKSWVAAVQSSFDAAITSAYEAAAQQAELQILLLQRQQLDEEDTLVALLFTSL